MAEPEDGAAFWRERFDMMGRALDVAFPGSWTPKVRALTVFIGTPARNINVACT